MQIYAAHKRFAPSCGESWSKFVEWSGFHQITELVSTDIMLCPQLINELIDEDWQYNIHADNRVYFFHDWQYLKQRIGYDPTRHNVLSLEERPDSPVVAPHGFELCGYDILDSHESISVLTNCGGFPGIFDVREVNQCGLLNDYKRALQVAASLRRTMPQDPHCGDCRVWSLSRYRDEDVTTT